MRYADIAEAPLCATLRTMRIEKMKKWHLMGETACPYDAPVAFPDNSVSSEYEDFIHFSDSVVLNWSNCHYFTFYRLFVYTVPKRMVKSKQTLQWCRFMCSDNASPPSLHLVLWESRSWIMRDVQERIPRTKCNRSMLCWSCIFRHWPLKQMLRAWRDSFCLCAQL